MSSAPEEPPLPPPKTTRGTTPAIHRDVIKIGTIVSEVQRDVVEVQRVLKTRENDSGQNKAVSNQFLSGMVE